MRILSIISLGLAVILALSLRPGAAVALEHPSVRISSLGGNHVAGVIPDLYTDLTTNPAYAFFADRLILSYARRGNPGYAPSLPYLSEDPDNYYGSYGSSMLVNELSVWGIRLSSWRAAVFAQWALNQPEDHRSDPGIETGSRYEVGLYEDWSSRDNDYARIDLIAARALGDRYAVGLRLQGWGYYFTESALWGRTSDYYHDPTFSLIDSRSLDTRAQTFCGRRFSFDLQAGVAKSDDAGPRSDLALKVSLNRSDRERQNCYLQISKGYDSEGLLDYYNYSRTLWSDARQGDLWSFALMLRHAFDGGIRVMTGGGVSTSSYETEWSDSRERIQWSSGVDQAIFGAFEGDGSLLGGNCFFKGGKMIALHETADLYLGLHGVFARTGTKEKPLIHYTFETDGDESAVRIDQPTRLESTEISFDLSVPLSVEFRPSGYFTFFSGFILTGNWNKKTMTRPTISLLYYNPPAAASRMRGANRAGTSSQVVIEPEAYTTDWKRTLNTGSAVTMGFSLHYRDRFFIDVYSGAEIIPDYLADQTIEIRYVF